MKLYNSDFCGKNLSCRFELKKIILMSYMGHCNFALNTLLHFASMLLHFALVLHFAAIVITFCGDYYILRRNSHLFEGSHLSGIDIKLIAVRTECSG